MNEPGNRIRQARRHGRMSQQALGERVGVHRSAVAQWEQAGGSHPTMENLGRIAISTGVSFEWLATGRGRMEFVSDLVPGDGAAAAVIEFSAHCETEARGLTAMRRMEFTTLMAVVELMESLADKRVPRMSRRAPYSR
ncbi:MAG: helix-turn-helix transcriptional regulator [Arenimonas sp.]|nr:helix-turn-helix transcriptional regulator [Arenimonas sp.]